MFNNLLLGKIFLALKKYRFWFIFAVNVLRKSVSAKVVIGKSRYRQKSLLAKVVIGKSRYRQKSLSAKFVIGKIRYRQKLLSEKVVIGKNGIKK